jgi:hypothetical protein
MVIQKEHAIALERLLADKEAGKAYTAVAPEDERIYLELERAGLASLPAPMQRVPTYLGEELARVLRQLSGSGALPDPASWPEGWRWVGSEVIAMLDAADRGAKVGPLAIEPLVRRGLAAPMHDREKNVTYVGLSDGGRQVLEIYRALEPVLEISAELAAAIRQIPMGPTESSQLFTGSHEEHLLEAMRLIAYSVPNSDVYAFTALGQAVKRALEVGGFATEGEVLSVPLLVALAAHVDGQRIAAETLMMLQSLEYVGAAGELLPAGEWALEAFRLLQEGARRTVWSFAVEAEEAEVLQAIHALWEKAAANPEEVPTFDRLRRAMIDRKVQEYQKLVEHYGRRLEEMPERRQEIARHFAEARDLAHWYDEHFDLRAVLFSLESLNLIEAREGERQEEVFRLTPFGERVRKDQAEHERDVTSAAVKSITMTRKTFSAPNLEWYRESREAGLIGTAEPTEAGLMYAELAERIHRKPYLTRYELLVFHHIPARGMDLDELYHALAGELQPEWIRWALGKLEARHLIEILPDGNIVETEAGERLDRALSGVPKGIGSPVNPILYRLLKALALVGTLYARERRVRVLPRNIETAIKLSGLTRTSFEDAISLARVAGFIGQNTINEAGILLLEAVEAMNPGERFPTAHRDLR